MSESVIGSRMLRDGIRSVLSPDPWLEQPDPETVEAVALFVEAIAQVSRKRRRELANEPWRLQTVVQHLEHATIHIDTAFHSAVEGDADIGLDRETGLRHLQHAGLRLAFTWARMQGIGAVARNCDTCAAKHDMFPECAMGCCPCDGCDRTTFSKWEPKP